MTTRRECVKCCVCNPFFFFMFPLRKWLMVRMMTQFHNVCHVNLRTWVSVSMKCTKLSHPTGTCYKSTAKNSARWIPESCELANKVKCTTSRSRKILVDPGCFLGSTSINTHARNKGKLPICVCHHLTTFIIFRNLLQK